MTRIAIAVLAVSGALVCAVPALAQVPPPTDALIVTAKESPAQTVYSWERNGVFTSVFPGDKTQVPYDATKIVVRIISFPRGVMVRHIHLDAGQRTHPNVAHEDILFYQVSGRRVQISNDESAQVDAGDASLQMSGNREGLDQLISGDVVEFAMRKPSRSDGRGVLAKASDAPVSATGPGYRVKAFKLDRYVIHEARLDKGAALPSKPPAVDTYVYVVSGSLAASVGKTAAMVEKDAVIRVPAGSAYSLKAIDPAVVVYTEMPPGADSGPAH